jgi:hypothetical protein
MKVKGLAVKFRNEFRTSDRSRVIFRGRQSASVALFSAERWSNSVTSAAFGQAGSPPDPAGMLSRSLEGVRLLVGASRGRVEVQTSGARGLPRDFAL